MASLTVQSRFDGKAQKALKRLMRQHGWSTSSQALRETVLRLDEQTTAKPRHRLIGVGSFDRGTSDAATNPKHMEGFGKKWRVDEWGKGGWDW
jgi:hypothetical protein